MSTGANQLENNEQTLDNSFKSKYLRLKRKYESLINYSFGVSEELYKEKKRVNKLKKEKNFLLDRLIKLEKKEKEDVKPISLKKKPSAQPEKVVIKTNIPTSSSPSSTSASKPSRSKDKDTSNATMCAASIGPNRPCKSRALAGSKYCWRHGPLDPNSEFMFCTYSDPNMKKKCSNPILKTKEIPFCTYHTPKAILDGFKVDSKDMSKEESEGRIESDMNVEASV